MFYKDLEPYKYLLAAPLPDVLTIGWLSCKEPFPVGQIPDDLVIALAEVISSQAVNQSRGYHICELCTPRTIALKLPCGEVAVPQPVTLTHQGREIPLGSAEIWVPSPDRTIVYAAPNLVYHYVCEHGYLPPTEFLTALLVARQSKLEWHGEDEFRRRVQACSDAGI